MWSCLTILAGNKTKSAAYVHQIEVMRLLIPKDIGKYSVISWERLSLAAFGALVTGAHSGSLIR